jgi:thioredoxin 1
MSEPEECIGGVCLIPEASADTILINGGDAVSDKEDVEEQPKKGDDRKNNASKKGAGRSSLIKMVYTQNELNELVSAQNAVVEFMTSWCGACKGIEPLYEELAAHHTDSVQSAQVMCDKNRETKKLASAYGIGSYPVFLVFENGKNVGKWNGADRGKLEKAFDRLGGGLGKGGKKKKKGGS